MKVDDLHAVTHRFLGRDLRTPDLGFLVYCFPTRGKLRSEGLQSGSTPISSALVHHLSLNASPLTGSAFGVTTWYIKTSGKAVDNLCLTCSRTCNHLPSQSNYSQSSLFRSNTKVDIMVPKPKITLYLDTVSPFAYEAYYILRVCTT